MTTEEIQDLKNMVYSLRFELKYIPQAKILFKYINYLENELKINTEENHRMYDELEKAKFRLEEKESEDLDT